MKKQLLLGGVAMAFALVSYTAFVRPSSAGWGPPFAPGAGAQAAKINWDQSAETPGEKVQAPVITGISASKQAPAPTEHEWTVEELKAGKPMMVYYFVGETKPTEENFKFARKTEFSAFSNDSVERINKNWVPKKVEIDFDADRKLAKNQARVEFWSFTGTKMDTIAHKNQQILNPSDFETRLKEMEKKNRSICDAQIKRINDAIERAKKEETASVK